MTFLIHADCDVDMVNADGDSPLHLACKVGGEVVDLVCMGSPQEQRTYSSLGSCVERSVWGRGACWTV